MTSFSTGREAENKAAQYLNQRGFKILSQNWRTRFCEIDLVAQKGICVYFVEVKYRHTDAQGSGLDYVTPQKLRQMQFAAEFWVSEHDWSSDYNLSAVEVTGKNFAVTSFITTLL
jgi:uncharacterized protein (TIGR00252 family)